MPIDITAIISYNNGSVGTISGTLFKVTYEPLAAGVEKVSLKFAVAGVAELVQLYFGQPCDNAPDMLVSSVAISIDGRVVSGGGIPHDLYEDLSQRLGNLAPIYATSVATNPVTPLR